MKTNSNIRNSIAATLAALIFAGSPVLGESYLIGLSPHYTTSDTQVVLKQVLLFALEQTAPGDKVLVYDALNQQPVTEFNIPEGKLFQNNARARAQRLAPTIATLRSFLVKDAATQQPGTGVIRLPEFLDLAGPQLRTPGQPLRVIVVASPFYLNPEMPSFNMDDAYPSDAHLLANQSVSVFGTALRRGRLAEVTVHYAYVGQGGFINDYHQERITRFWSLFISQQDGVLATFAPDVNLAFRRAGEGVHQPIVSAQLDARDDKIQMLPVNRRPVPRWLAPATPETAAEPLVNSAAAAALPESLRNADLPVQTTHGQIGIGIMWAAPVDCDLWVKASPAARDLFFQNRTTPEGRYFHDYRSANHGVDYEYIELNPADLASVKAWVNLYAGEASNISGVVVVRLNGQTHRGEFRLQATEGNKAVDRQQRDHSPHWVELDLLRIVGIGAATASASTP